MAAALTVMINVGTRAAYADANPNVSIVLSADGKTYADEIYAAGGQFDMSHDGGATWRGPYSDQPTWPIAPGGTMTIGHFKMAAGLKYAGVVDVNQSGIKITEEPAGVYSWAVEKDYKASICFLVMRNGTGSYTVRYDPNGGAGTMPDQAFTWTSDIESMPDLSKNAFTRTGYVFAGWNTQPDGSGTSFADGQSGYLYLPTDETVPDDGTVTLYAQWRANVLTVNYYSPSVDVEADPAAYSALGGTVPAGTLLRTETAQYDSDRSDYPAYRYGNIRSTQTTYSKTGLVNYESAGCYFCFSRKGYRAQTYWRIGSATSEKTISADENYTTVQELAQALGAPIEKADAEVNVYAVMSPYYLTFEYNANGGRVDAEQSHARGTFDTASDGTIMYSDNSGTPTVNGKLAHVNLHHAGSGNTDATRVTIDDRFDPVDPGGTWLHLEKTGYHIWPGGNKGWNTGPDGSGTTVSESGNDTAEDCGADLSNGDAHITLYANWQPNSYTVRFDPNGAGGSMEDEAMTYDASEKLSGCSITRPGYRFAGWNTKADGTGTAYPDGASVSNLTAEQNGVVTLYAQWVPKAYTVSIPTRAEWSGMPAGKAEASASYDVKVSGEFDGTVKVTGSQGALTLGNAAIAADAESRAAPLSFATTGTKQDTVNVTGSALLVGKYTGTIGYTVENEL